MKPHRFFHDETGRRRWQNPEAILSEIGLKPGNIFIDIGCNDGFFAIPAARIIGEKGKVYGVDIDGQAIKRLVEKARKENLKNIYVTVGEAEETVLCDGCADIVFFGIDLHDFKNPAKVLMNTKRMLKPGGLLIDLDWKKEPMELGPPIQIRFSEKEAVNLIKSQGFKIEAVKEAGPHHYIITAKP